MRQSRDFYLRENKNSNINLYSPDIDYAIADGTTNGSFSSAWAIHAAASVIRCPIKSVYPVINGPSDHCIVILIRQFPLRPKPNHKRSYLHHVVG